MTKKTNKKKIDTTFFAQKLDYVLYNVELAIRELETNKYEIEELIKELKSLENDSVSE